LQRPITVTSRTRAPASTRPVPARRPRPLADVAAEAAGCRRCDLWRLGRQTVFGEGPANAEVMLVGEQPGDREDLAGEPFVGPAGQLLRKAIEDSGLGARRVYLTNAVKHFKWQARGKRRIHERPNTEEVLACQIWLELEIDAIAPRLIVALGATAVRTLLGTSVRVLRDRGRTFPGTKGSTVLVTVHPSSILRAPDETARHDALRAFVDDLRAAAAHLDRS
jgi:DNA polymerase